MKTVALALTASITLLAGCAISHNGVADSHGTNVASAKQCPVCTDHGLSGKQGLEWFKGLAGKDGKESRWVAVTKDEHGKDKELAVKYKVISNGSAVCETLFPGGEEMITVYHLDGDRLTATHYCALGNQPRMQATLCACDSARKTCEFHFLDGTNMDASKDSFMGNQDYTFAGPDTLTIAWHHLGPGGVDNKPTFGGTFKRAK
ncbi:MAG TPA: hypothetical protein VEB22_10795 [Phycisphaerales bacterium]|nr:hypothetical protein [Phycisphaerales bacterium]